MRSEFAVHKLNEEGLNEAQILSEQFNMLAEYIDKKCMPTRERALAFTKLEEACFFAKKALATNLNYQQQ